jgi:DNA invertase Pin-like site-specific DNA recombinase
MTVLAAVAQFERGLISERIKDAKCNLRRANKHQGSAQPFGYRVEENGEKKLVPIAEEQTAIVDMGRGAGGAGRHPRRDPGVAAAGA